MQQMHPPALSLPTSEESRRLNPSSEPRVAVSLTHSVPGEKLLTASVSWRRYCLLPYWLYENALMSDSRFDGMKIYKMNGGRAAIYDIRGSYIHRANRASQAYYEIRGDFIHKTRNRSSPVFEIRGKKVHKAYRGSIPLYEIR